MMRVPTEEQKAAARREMRSYVQSFFADQKRREIKAAFAHLGPVFEVFGIAVTCKGKLNPVWTLKRPGAATVTINSDGAVSIKEGMTTARKQAQARWGLERQLRLAAAAEGTDAGRQGDAMARRFFRAEGRKAKRLYEKQERETKEGKRR
jgi:hypothetical protein